MKIDESAKIRLLIVDDQSLIRQGLKAMLEQERDLQVVGDAENGKVALEMVAQLQPDVVLMDIRMPEMDGRTATKLIVENYPHIKVLILSTFDDDTSLAGAMRAGAKGYLLKDMPSSELANAIRFGHYGYTQFGPGLFDKLLAKETSPAETSESSAPAKLSELTAREQEVLQLIGVGATNREIAQKLYITEGTVKTHVTSILNRLNLKNRSQLAIYANTINHKSAEGEVIGNR
ncbi:MULTISPECIES: response regulator transcription factor [unclassified Tolypothrix]|uniref:response regulator transcription factor n=1 Tax=unclassified Tolypothrix TaxID=2649714 RepID=UPI0005F85BA7|nr:MULTISPECIES: response regulator transcription factor [unclassified Tolypothrix]MBE9087534.1 response regulator transcription factor [Tolypothrix sp. LEGE 11397]UYD30129.1 response regulator transcription factor [Tolypothrix sp. PCC 7712]UYD37943.1 response regulator transcription factor [Tolypothrix sp. PCC 7601]